MDAKTLIGRTIRSHRERLALSQESVAEHGGISYQYLSALENGKENFTIGVLEALCQAVESTVPLLVADAFSEESVALPFPRVNAACFRPDVPMPPQLTIFHLQQALDETQRIIHLINAALLASVKRPLARFIQGNNFSGIVSNLLSDCLSRLSPYKHNSAQAYPDLACLSAAGGTLAGLEVKATINVGKGGESHNGHSGWHLIAAFHIDPESGNILFVHIQMAELRGHQDTDPDWNYQRSQVKKDTGSQRTETYITNLRGTTKLRDGSVYLDPAFVNFSRWRQARIGDIPPYSIFHAPMREQVDERLPTRKKRRKAEEE